MSRHDRFSDLMRAFFYEWLVEQRNASIHTVRSYATPGGCCFGSLRSVLGRRWL